MKTRRLIGYVLLLAVGIASPGCATRYAQLYVRTVDRDEHPVGDCRVLSAADGTVLGSSLQPIPLRRSGWSPRPVLALLIERQHYQREWRMIRVPRWATTEQEALEAAFRNDLVVHLVPCSVGAGDAVSAPPAPP